MRVEILNIDSAPEMDSMRPSLTNDEWDYCTRSSVKELNLARVYLTFKTKEILGDFNLEIQRQNSRPFINKLYNLGYSHKNKLLGIAIAPYPENMAIDIEDLNQKIDWNLFYQHTFSPAEIFISKENEELNPFIIFASKEVVMKIEARSLDLRQIEVLKIDCEGNIFARFQHHNYALSYKKIDGEYVVVSGKKVEEI